jgi:hypothetical protein
MYKFMIKTFDQLKNDNFDQLIFGQTTPCQRNRSISFPHFKPFFFGKIMAINDIQIRHFCTLPNLLKQLYFQYEMNIQYILHKVFFWRVIE